MRYKHTPGGAANSSQIKGRPVAKQQPGHMLVSIDFEMAWGLVHRNGASTYDIEDERRWLGQLLDVFDQHHVPATWATVGHLLLDACSTESGVKHPDVGRPDYSWFEGDWFAADPCGDVATEPRWYAPDVVADILRRTAGHELGSHSFSHLIVGDEACTAEHFRSELVACSSAADRFGETMKSFVYPRNTIGHVEELISAGYSNYRGRRDDPFTGLGAMAKPARLLDKVLPSSRSVVHPRWEEGIWNLPATCMFTIEGRKHPRSWLAQVKRRMHHAARQGGLFHVWFHPHNLVLGGEQSIEIFGELLAEAAKLRDRGQLETVTMADLAESLVPPNGRVDA